MAYVSCFSPEADQPLAEKAAALPIDPLKAGRARDGASLGYHDFSIK